MSTRELTQTWDTLQPIQRQAAEWDKGPLLVLAGPGSGKTRVLTCRIAHLLDSSRDKNFRILALTFTNKAADEMRNRVRNLVPGLEDRLFLGTFHSFCADVLRQHGTHLNIKPNFQIYSQDADLLEILSDAVEEAKNLSPLISDLDKKTLPIIQRLKSLLIFPDDCRKVFSDPRIGERIAIVYPAYEAELAKHNALDFSSLILRTYQLFDKFHAFAKRYRTVYPYICIDEFQDTNSAQYALVRALTGEQHNNVFVVADDDQIIYQWNGASHQRIVDFLNDYSAKIIQLPVVYRCPPEIVELANNLIRHNFLRTSDKQPLQAFQAKPSLDTDVVRLLPVFPNFVTEAVGVAKDIKKLHSTQLSSVVVLGRNRRLLSEVERALRIEGVAAIISQRKDEFESLPFMWLHSILRLTNNRQSQAYLEKVCGTFFGLTEIRVDSENVITQAQASNKDFLSQWVKAVLDNGNHLNSETRAFMGKIPFLLGERKDFRQFSNLALNWFSHLLQKLQQTTNIPNGEEAFVHYGEEVQVWNDLMREISESLGKEITLEAFLQELQMHSKEPPLQPNTVTLMTIHGAKGKEFDHVYLVGLVDDELPSFQSKKKGPHSPEMEEERRNCFVAITRTRKTLTLSYAEEYRGWRKTPSRFLSEMGLLGDQAADG